MATLAPLVLRQHELDPHPSGTTDPECAHAAALRRDPAVHRASPREREGPSWPAAIVFGIAAVTDQIDGYLARRWSVESQFGKVADPLADRLMIDVAVVMLVWLDRLPWLALVILLRDVLLIGGYKLVVPRGYSFDVSRLGKIATWGSMHRSASFSSPAGHVVAARMLLGQPRPRGRRAAVQYVRRPCARCSCEGRGDGGRRRDATPSLTSNQPKPMVPIVGKPCMEHILELLAAYGFEEVVVTLAFMPQAIRTYFGDGDRLGFEIEYSSRNSRSARPDRCDAAAGSTRRRRHLGDALCDIDLGALVARHREQGAAVTIGLKSVDDPLEFGIVVSDEDGRVERFLEKPSWGQVFSDTINTGIYVSSPRCSDMCRGPPVRFLEGAVPAAPRDGQADLRHVLDGYWQDIGTLEQFRQANFDALDERVRLSIPGIRLRGNVWLGEGVEIGAVDNVEGPAFIGNNCKIAPDAVIGPYTVLSQGVTVRDRGRVERSVVDAAPTSAEPP